MTALFAPQLYDQMAVQVPEGTKGNVTIERFEATAGSFQNLLLAIESPRRVCKPGTYTRMLLDGKVWMSDTTAERIDHLGPALAIHGRLYDEAPVPAGSVLLGGLGLGMILRVALLAPTVTRVDVVEANPEVIALVGPHYQELAADCDVELTIHEGDLFAKRWPPGAWWDVAWFDIWPHLSTENLEGMARLNRSYAQRTGWKGCWGQSLILAARAEGRL